jgi:hypothetical protein
MYTRTVVLYTDNKCTVVLYTENKSTAVLYTGNKSTLVLYTGNKSTGEQVNFQWDDDEVRFVLDQHAYLDLYSASSLKQQSMDRHVAPLGHIILVLSQPVFVMRTKSDIYVFIILG